MHWDRRNIIFFQILAILLFLQDKCTPIHGAAEKGHNEVVKTLINLKADINAVTVVCNY